MIIRRFREALARKRLAGRDFSIISNNCWGAHVYQRLGRAYATPFVGLFLSPSSYLELLKNFRQNIALPLQFKTASCEDWINQIRSERNNFWPVGTLGDHIEIQFMHFKSEAEAREKWTRRVARLLPQPEQWLFKFCDGGCTDEQITTFDELPYPHKVLFTTRRDCPARCAVRIPSDEPCVPDGLSLSRISPAYFDTADCIKGGTGRVVWWTRWSNCI